MTQLAADTRSLIRPAAAADLPGLEWDGQYAQSRAVSRHAWEEAQAGQRAMLVAEADGAVVGQVFLQLHSSERQFADGATRGYIYALRVRPEWRNRGLGTRLMRAAGDELRGRGFQVGGVSCG